MDVSGHSQVTLSARYQAAWGESAARIGLRQQVIQMYLTAAGVLFGFYFDPRGALPGTILAWGVTLLTLFASLLIWMHNRVIFRVSAFLASCEKHSAKVSEASMEGHAMPAYFWGPEEGIDWEKGARVHEFHGGLRKRHRFVLAGVLLVTDGLAIYLTHTPNGPFITTNCTLICAASVLLLVRDLWLR